MINKYILIYYSFKICSLIAIFHNNKLDSIFFFFLFSWSNGFVGVCGNQFFGQIEKFLNWQQQIFGERPVWKHDCSQLGLETEQNKSN